MDKLESDSEPKSKPGLVRKLNWSVVGVVVGVLFGIPAMIAVWPILSPPAPRVSYEITNESNVLDVHKRMKNLTILFQTGSKDEDIQKTGQNLRIIAVRVHNSGQVDVLQNLYDQQEPWGFRLTSGTIVEDPRVVDASSDYIRRKLASLLKAGGNTVTFPKIILEHGASFTLEILVLHDQERAPRILPLGKIAGLDRIRILRSLPSAGRATFVQQLISGGPWINLTRIVLLLLLSLAILILITTLIDRTNMDMDTRRWWEHVAARKNLVSHVLAAAPSEEKAQIEVISRAIEHGHDPLIVRALLDSEDFLEAALRVYQLAARADVELAIARREVQKPTAESLSPWFGLSGYEQAPDVFITDMLSAGALRMDDNRVVVDDAYRRALDWVVQRAKAFADKQSR